MLLPCGLEIRLGLLNKETGDYLREFRWKNVARFGEHATDGSYVSVDLHHKDVRFNLECAVDDDNIVLRASPEKGENDYLLAVEVFFNWSKKGYITKKDEIMEVEAGESRYFVRCLNKILAKIEPPPAPKTYPYLLRRKIIRWLSDFWPTSQLCS